MTTLRQDRSEFNVLFVHSELDDYGLDANEFRIYAHLARRANGKNRAWPGMTSMSIACRMNRHTVLRVIFCLECYGLIKIIKKQGATNQYVLTPPSEWKQPKLTSAPEGTGAPIDTSAYPDTGASFDPSVKRGTGVVPLLELPPVSKEALKGNPIEGNPLKDNTVVGPVTVALPPPGGSVTASHHAALNGKPSNHRPSLALNGEKHPQRQSPITRKAYAIASRLQALHWDNCKILYSLHPARAYAERALGEGHDESRIVTAYSEALRYCHGVATDEINRGRRSVYEKATCALTVTLAAEQLSRDNQTSGQRWEMVIERLQEEYHREQVEEARITEEIAHAGPQIAAWFMRETTTRRGETDTATVVIAEHDHLDNRPELEPVL